MGFLTRLDSSIKNQKSPDFHVKVGRGFLPRLDSSIKNQKSKIKNRQTSTSKSGGDFSLASTLQSKIKNQKSKID
jgi:hypothetical protein